MGVFQIDRKKLPLDYDNDRIILILLSLKEKKTFREQRRYSRLKRRYEDNNIYEKDIIEKLITAGYVQEIDLEPDKPKQNNTGETIQHKVKYKTSESGCRALKEGRFLSEYRSIMWKRVGSGLQWGVALISIIGGISGFYAKCESTSFTTPPTMNEAINTTDSTIITPEMKAISENQYDSSSIQSGRSKYSHSDKNQQSNLKASDKTKIHPITE